MELLCHKKSHVEYYSLKLFWDKGQYSHSKISFHSLHIRIYFACIKKIVFSHYRNKKHINLTLYH